MADLGRLSVFLFGERQIEISKQKSYQKFIFIQVGITVYKSFFRKF